MVAEKEGGGGERKGKESQLVSLVVWKGERKDTDEEEGYNVILRFKERLEGKSGGLRDGHLLIKRKGDEQRGRKQ